MAQELPDSYSKIIYSIKNRLKFSNIFIGSRTMAIETYHFGERKCEQRGQTYLPASVS